MIKSGHRIFFRLRVRFGASVRHQGQKKRHKVRVRDISSQGIGLETELPLTTGAEIQVQFRLPGQLRSMDVPGCVVFESEKPNKKRPGMRHIGVRFTDCPEKAEKKIAQFILRESAFALSRWVLLALGILGFFVLAAHGAVCALIHVHAGTLFGAEWLPRNWSMLSLGGLAGLHAVLAAGFLLAAAGYFSFYRGAPQFIFIFGLLGLMMQLVRVVLKVPYLTYDTASRIMLYGETAGLAVFTFSLMLILLMGSRFNGLIESMNLHLNFPEVALRREKVRYRLGH